METPTPGFTQTQQFYNSNTGKYLLEGGGRARRVSVHAHPCAYSQCSLPLPGANIIWNATEQEPRDRRDSTKAHNYYTGRTSAGSQLSCKYHH